MSFGPEARTVRDILEGLRTAVDPQLFGRALGALERTFPPGVLSRMRAAAGNGYHPFEFEGMWFGNAVEILELGLALDELPALKRRQREILRDLKQYQPTRSEFWAGLLLHRSGAAVQYEPKSTGRRKVDWMAQWKDGAVLALETKRLDTGEAHSSLIRFREELYLYMEEALVKRPIAVESAIRVHVRSAWLRNRLPEDLDENLIPGIAQGGGDEILLCLREVLSKVPAASGIYELGEIGTCRIAAGLPRLDIEFVDDESVLEGAVRRLRRVVTDGADQTRSAAVPGIVLVDPVEQLSALHALEHLQDEVRAAPWAANLAAVGLRMSESFTAASVPYVWLVLVPGPKAQAIPIEFWRVFATCPSRHLHFEPFLPKGEAHLCRSVAGVLTDQPLLRGELELRDMIAERHRG